MTAPTVATYLKSIQHASTTTYVSAIFAHRVASHRTTPCWQSCALQSDTSPT
jgi:hypothetical protein